MTMIPGAAAPHQNISCIKKHCHGGYVGGGCTSIGSFSCGVMSRLEEGYRCSSGGEEAPPSTPTCLLLGSSSDLVLDDPQIMAEQHQDESIRTDQSTVNEAAGSSNLLKDQDDKGDDDHDHRDRGWLQLSIGGFTAAATSPRHNYNNNNNSNDSNNDKQQEEDYDDDDQVLLPDHRRSSPRGRGGMIELDLLPIGSWTSCSSQQQQDLRSYFGPNSMFHVGGPAEFRDNNNYYMNASSNLFLQHPVGPGRGATISSPSFPPHQEINWPPNFIRPVSRTTLVSSTTLHPSSSSTSLVVPPYFTRPFPLHAEQGHVPTTARPVGIDFRVIDPPPRRPHSGIWFMLQAAQNQANEPFLPQISKSILRIKDGGMTIRLVIKYLVNKLNLASESEIEIRCRGQQVLSSLTLQHVRDSIWSPSDVVTLLPDSSTTDHLMVLHYGRSS